MNDINLTTFHKQTIHNRGALEQSEKCGCFYCKQIFAPLEIKEWTDDNTTAICPYCSIDSVIPEGQVSLSEEILDVLNKKYFQQDKDR